MPAKSEKQRKLMGADLARKREGKKTKTGMSEKQLKDYASKKNPNDHREENEREMMKMKGGHMMPNMPPKKMPMKDMPPKKMPMKKKMHK